jgi:GDP-L-fucose synthase
MKILVTGGTGMVGKHLQEMFSPDEIWNREVVFIGSQDYDLRDSVVVRRLFENKFDTVIHLAAKVGGIQDNIANPLEFLEDNLIMNTNVVKAAYESGVTKFIGIGSTCVYPDILPDDHYPMTEDMLHIGAPTPTNFGYGYAKRILSVHLETIRKSRGLDYFTIFPSNLYSEYDHFDDDTKAHFVTALLKKIKESKDGYIHLFGTGLPLRQFIHAEDLAKVIMKCLDREIKEDFNVCCDDAPMIMEIAEAGLKAAGKRLGIMFDSTKPDGQYRKDCSNAKMKELFPDFKFLPLEDGLKRVYNRL